MRAILRWIIAHLLAARRRSHRRRASSTDGRVAPTHVV